jgi:RNA polymerase sigma-70 factor (ECF subfamily)
MADLTVVRASAGDLSAFEQLYRQHAPRVYGLCLRMTADPTRAEDQTQETFVRAWDKIGSYRGESLFSTWLCRVAVNVVRGDRRARVRREARECALDEQELPGTAASSPLDLERAIGQLPEGAREVFVLHDVEGYRHAEIAELLDVSVGTSKSQLHRARKLLREVLQS